MTGNRSVTASDLNKVDAHRLGTADDDDIPELTDDWFAKAQAHRNGKPTPRGRPRSASPKQAVNLRLSQRVLRGFREDGPGWQTRINAALEQWLDKHASAARSQDWLYDEDGRPK